MKTNSKRQLWFYTLKRSLNKYTQIHCIKPDQKLAILKGSKIKGKHLEFIVKLLPDTVQLKIKQGKDTQAYYFLGACNKDMMHDIAVEILTGGFNAYSN